MNRHNPMSQRAERRRQATWQTDAPDVRETDWHRFVEQIDALLDDDGLLWAAPSLRAIQGTVLDAQRVTDAQRQAVAHIAAGRALSGWHYLTRPGRVRP